MMRLTRILILVASLNGLSQATAQEAVVLELLPVVPATAEDWEAQHARLIQLEFEADQLRRQLGIPRSYTCELRLVQLDLDGLEQNPQLRRELAEPGFTEDEWTRSGPAHYPTQQALPALQRLAQVSLLREEERLSVRVIPKKETPFAQGGVREELTKSTRSEGFIGLRGALCVSPVGQDRILLSLNVSQTDVVSPMSNKFWGKKLPPETTARSANFQLQFSPRETAFFVFPVSKSSGTRSVSIAVVTVQPD
ncbi:hypothetical protein [Planctomicrobium sp. SH664]|uniref:hypothetical protein n=1 Tax=Planctomicrobium sp. SH664 TaxID=3448125 RepID=UPI003F5CB8C2